MSKQDKHEARVKAGNDLRAAEKLMFIATDVFKWEFAMKKLQKAARAYADALDAEIAEREGTGLQG